MIPPPPKRMRVRSDVETVWAGETGMFVGQQGALIWLRFENGESDPFTADELEEVS